MKEKITCSKAIRADEKKSWKGSLIKEYIAMDSLFYESIKENRAHLRAIRYLDKDRS